MTTREQRRQLVRDNAKQPAILTEVAKANWPDTSWMTPQPTRVWRSQRYLAVEYPAPAPALVRLSIQTTILVAEDWADGLRWDQLQQIKRECGYGSYDAVEVYPADADIVNVANMRHLWIMAVPLTFKWCDREPR